MYNIFRVVSASSRSHLHLATPAVTLQQRCYPYRPYGAQYHKRTHFHYPHLHQTHCPSHRRRITTLNTNSNDSVPQSGWRWKHKTSTSKSASRPHHKARDKNMTKYQNEHHGSHWPSNSPSSSTSRSRETRLARQTTRTPQVTKYLHLPSLGLSAAEVATMHLLSP